MTRRIPQSIRFAAGRVVKIRLVSDTTMREVMTGTELADGFWNQDLNIVYIRRDIDKDEQEEVFYHEMHHVVTDFERASRIENTKARVENAIKTSAPQLVEEPSGN